jgi:hypothetical protein
MQCMDTYLGEAMNGQKSIRHGGEVREDKSEPVGGAVPKMGKLHHLLGLLDGLEDSVPPGDLIDRTMSRVPALDVKPPIGNEVRV